MILFNLKIAWRNIRKNKIFSSINIIGLAVSMACCTVICFYIRNELNHDKFHKNITNIYRITEKQNQAGDLFTVAVTPGRLAAALKKDFPEVKETVRFGSWGGLLKNGSRAFEENSILLTDNSIFKVFDFELLKGNATAVLQSPGDIVLTETTCEKYFGKDWRNNDAILGQSFTMGNDVFTLAGVVKDPPQNSSIRFNVLLPLTWLFATDEWANKWNSNNFHTYVQLQPATNAMAFQQKIEKQLKKYSGQGDLLQLQPLKDQYLYSNFDFKTDWGKRSDIKYIRIFTAVGLLLLIVACVNFINLSTARSLKRAMEVGVRKVTGSTRQQLVWQFLGESVLITTISGIAAMLMVKLVQPSLETITGAPINTHFSSPFFIIVFFSFILFIGCLGGLYPALMLSGFKPVKVFRNAAGSQQGKLFRQGLVVFQFAVSVTLIIGTFFMFKQLRFMQQKELGFDKEQLLTVRLNGELAGKPVVFKKELSRLSSIAAVAAATMSMVDVGNSSYLEWNGMQEKEKFLVTQANVDPDFIPTLNVKLISGKNFSAQYTNDTATYILNESAVKKLGNTVTNVLGRKLKFWGAEGTVIGVVKDFHFKPLTTGIGPFIFRYQPQDRYFNMFVKTVPGQIQLAIKQIKTLYSSLEKEHPIQFSFVNEELNKLYQQDLRTATIIELFAGFSIFIGCLGLFGLTVFATEQRTREIGIRKVLGAGIASVTALLSKDFLKLILVAIVIAFPVAWYGVHKWLQGFAFKINMEWWLFAMPGLAVLFVALLTISLHAVKAALMDPVKSLRSE